ncbi:MAG: hydroxymyristoyl-ACP dehydratase [Angelakisella sp.]|nr:hydroxymyristoyl-ACP dehydratase [Angelakisella sp.]MCI9528271.1 hydroxymyristoyl-ACP dehydratase [Angelakisella sp.]
MNLIVCSENCIHQQDGYCVLEHPCAIPNPKGPLENRCIYLETPGEVSGGPSEGR